MSLSRKLLSGFAAMIALVFVLSCGALIVISELNGDLDRAANVTARKEYLAHQGETLDNMSQMLWDAAVVEDFNKLREKGRDHPLMADIEDAFRKHAARTGK